LFLQTKVAFEFTGKKADHFGHLGDKAMLLFIFFGHDSFRLAYANYYLAGLLIKLDYYALQLL